MKKYALTLLLSTAPIFAGTPAPMAPAPAPQCDCEQGWTFGFEVLALKPYQSRGQYEDYDSDSESSGDISGNVIDGDWSAAYRASLGYEFSDCLFTKVTFFGGTFDTIDESYSDSYNEPQSGDHGTYNHDLSGDIQVSYLDWVVGKHWQTTENLTISPFIGLRWATIDANATDKATYNDYDRAGLYYTEQEKDSYESDYSGLGIVVGADVTYAFGSSFAAYGTFKQSIVWGKQDINNKYTYSENDDGDTSDSDPVDKWGQDQSAAVSITEVGLGLQYNFCFSSVSANIRLGAEAQYWTGLEDNYLNGDDLTLAGFVLGANFRF